MKHGVEERANVGGGSAGSWAEGSEQQGQAAGQKKASSSTKQQGNKGGGGSYLNMAEVGKYAWLC